MSSVQKGNARVDSCLAQLSALGYRCMAAKASGRRGQRRQDLEMLAGDGIGFAPIDSLLPHVIFEAGGVNKRAEAIFREMLANGPLPPGFIPIAMVCVKRRWKYFRPGVRFAFKDLLEALRAEV